MATSGISASDALQAQSVLAKSALVDFDHELPHVWQHIGEDGVPGGYSVHLSLPQLHEDALIFLPLFYCFAMLMVATACQCRCCPGDYFLKPVNWIVPPTLSTSWVFRKNGSSALGKAGLTKRGLTELRRRFGESFHDLSKA